MKVTFDKNASEFILEAFGKKLNSEGFIVDKKDDSIFSLNKNGEKVHIDSFIGIEPNGQVLDNSSIQDLLFD